jgi:hypothetical protein
MSTYTPISTQTLSSTASSVTFSGIPQTYTDLIIVFNGTLSSGTSVYGIRYNSDSGSNYSWTSLRGDGSAASSARDSNSSRILCGWIGTSQVTEVIQIQNYSNSTTNKTNITRNNSTAASTYVSANVGLWRNTAAITSVTILPDSSTFASGSTFTLYGIGAGSPKAFGGDEVTTDGTYWYHIYRSSGVFAPMQNLSCDYLVVAGGAGGGSGRGGGGGAGGLRSTVTATGGGGSLETALSLTSGSNYTVTIGGGGAGGVNDGNGVAGSNSVFSTITSTGGGFGGGYQKNGGNGGSGGGAAGVGGGSSTSPGTGTTNQGFAGGQDSTTGGGGGGGASAVGGNAGANGGTGGAALAVSITGSSVSYAGGGGGGNSGGSGGTGGGGGAGNGSSTNTGGSATANTGSGGGGCDGNPSTAGNGGSGIVVIRYSAA